MSAAKPRDPAGEQLSAPDEDLPFPVSISCPVCGIGTMWLVQGGDGEWFYRCDNCGTIAFP